MSGHTFSSVTKLCVFAVRHAHPTEPARCYARGAATSFAFAKWHRGKTRLPDLLVARDVLLAMPARLSSREGVAPIRLPADIVNSAQRALLALLEVVGACLAPQPRFFGD